MLAHLWLVGCESKLDRLGVDRLLWHQRQSRAFDGDAQLVDSKLLELCFDIRGSSRVRSHGLRTRRRQTTAHLSRLWVWYRRLAVVGEVVELSIVIEFIIVIKVGELLEVELVAHDGADTTETAHELVALG